MVGTHRASCRRCRRRRNCRPVAWRGKCANHVNYSRCAILFHYFMRNAGAIRQHRCVQLCHTCVNNANRLRFELPMSIHTTQRAHRSRSSKHIGGGNLSGAHIARTNAHSQTHKGLADVYCEGAHTFVNASFVGQTPPKRRRANARSLSGMEY